VDWFTALEAPTQVAIIGVVTALVAAIAGVAVAIVNNRKAGGGRAEIAALTVDSSSIKQVAAAIEANTLAQIEANMLTKTHSGTVDRLAKATEELAEGVDDLKNEVIRSAAKLK
jgi:ABC-type spermidine/putrescine transport system permease subunit II